MSVNVSRCTLPTHPPFVPFTGVRGIEILRTSPFGHSRKFACVNKVLRSPHSPGPTPMSVAGLD
jgi:hypothetical protein